MRKWILALLVIVALVIAACGGDEATPAPATETATEVATEAAVEEAPTVEATAEATTEATEEAAPAAEASAPSGTLMLPAVNPLAVSGDIIAAGSSTVYPLAERMAERFIAEGYAGNITIDSIGSGAGFERFCVAGETDISNASRPIKDTEIESCGSIGRTPIEFRVGTDALAVVVNPENDWIGPEGVTVEELAKLFSAETTNWSDVNPAWPEEPVKRFSPGTDSGTFDFFIEAVMDATYENGEEQLLSAANLQLSEDDNVLVQGVAGDKNGIGYFGYAYFEENAGRLRDLAIEGISPSEETVDRGEYPLARPLFVYSDANIMSSKPQVADYINFLLSNVNEEIISVGYFPASDEALNQAKQSWLDAMGMEGAAMETTAAAASMALPAVNPLAVSGDIIAAGSSTVYPLAERMAERFIAEGYAGNITIDSIGSGAGFERFCVAGETDISNASRPIKDYGDRELWVDRADADRVPRGDGCAGGGGESGERLDRAGRRDGGRVGEAVLGRDDELVGCEPGVAGGAGEALQPWDGQRDVRLLHRSGDGCDLRERRGAVAECGEPAVVGGRQRVGAGRGRRQERDRLLRVCLL